MQLSQEPSKVAGSQPGTRSSVSSIPVIFMWRSTSDYHSAQPIPQVVPQRALLRVPSGLVTSDQFAGPMDADANRAGMGRNTK